MKRKKKKKALFGSHLAYYEMFLNASVLVIKFIRTGKVMEWTVLGIALSIALHGGIALWISLTAVTDIHG